MKTEAQILEMMASLRQDIIDLDDALDKHEILIGAYAQALNELESRYETLDWVLEELPSIEDQRGENND